MSAPGTPKASPAAVAAVQEALGCVILPAEDEHYAAICFNHRARLTDVRTCPVAVAAADAAAPHNGATAWDEGYAAGQTDPECERDNPYRIEDEP